MSWMNDQSQASFRTQLAALKALDEQKQFPKSGPNNWDEVTPEDFGDWDYEIYDHGDSWVFYPVSNAALQWAYKHFPENGPRWGAKGFIVDYPLSNVYSELILEKATEDKLVSEDEYNTAMEEHSQLIHQGESQARPEDG